MCILSLRPFTVQSRNEETQRERERDNEGKEDDSVIVSVVVFTLMLIINRLTLFAVKTGIDRFCQDIKAMTGFCPGIYWRVCWKFIAPIFLMVSFIDRLNQISPHRNWTSTVFTRPTVYLESYFQSNFYCKRASSDTDCTTTGRWNTTDIFTRLGLTFLAGV